MNIWTLAAEGIGKIVAIGIETFIGAELKNKHMLDQGSKMLGLCIVIVVGYFGFIFEPPITNPINANIFTYVGGALLIFGGFTAVYAFRKAFRDDQS